MLTLLSIWLTALQPGNRIGLDMLLFYRIIKQRLDDCLMSVVRRISQMRESIEVLREESMIADFNRPSAVLTEQRHQRSLIGFYGLLR